MIYDALKNLNDTNGSDATAIVSFIEVRDRPSSFAYLVYYATVFFLFYRYIVNALHA